MQASSFQENISFLCRYFLLCSILEEQKRTDENMENAEIDLDRTRVCVCVCVCVYINFVVSLQRNILYVMLDVGKTDRPAWIQW
jgi:hypothetical protein